MSIDEKALSAVQDHFAGDHGYYRDMSIRKVIEAYEAAKKEIHEPCGYEECCPTIQPERDNETGKRQSEGVDYLNTEQLDEPSHEQIVKIARDYAERFGMPHNAGKGFRLSHEDDMTKGITAAIYDAIKLASPKRESGELTYVKEVRDLVNLIGAAFNMHTWKAEPLTEEEVENLRVGIVRRIEAVKALLSEIEGGGS